MDVDFLTDNIRELCARLVVAQGAEFELVIDEFRTFIHEHRELIDELLRQPPLEVPPALNGQDCPPHTPPSTAPPRRSFVNCG